MATSGLGKLISFLLLMFTIAHLVNFLIEGVEVSTLPVTQQVQCFNKRGGYLQAVNGYTISNLGEQKKIGLNLGFHNRMEFPAGRYPAANYWTRLT